MVDDFLAAIALLLVVEGIMPFVSPLRWQETMRQLSEQSPRFVRIMGLVSMFIGIIMLNLVR